MIGKIELRNFKCFETLSLTCSRLTLLCGMNGTGKSSLLQALLVLRQSFAAGELQEGRLVLSGELADLGTGNDVLFEGAETDAVEIELHRDDAPTPCSFSFDYLRGADELRAQSAISSTEQGSEMLAWWGEVPPLGGNLFHVDAERMGPRKALGLSETSDRFGHPGALNYLHARQEETLPSFDPRCPDLSDRRLSGVFHYWLQEVTPGAHLQLERTRDAGALTSGFTFDRPGKGITRRYRDKNSGFGLSCALPVLAALLSPPGSLCLIENPEAHLHPRGQTRVGRPGGSRFAGRCAGDRRNAQRPLHGRCTHSRPGRADSSGSNSVPLLRARPRHHGGDLSPGEGRWSSLVLAGRVLRSA